MDMCEDILEVIQNSEKAHIEKQALDWAKKELEHECSRADAFISTFSEPGAMGGQHLPNTASQQNQHQHVAVPPVPTQYQFNLTGITPPVPPK